MPLPFYFSVLTLKDHHIVFFLRRRIKEEDEVQWNENKLRTSLVTDAYLMDY